VVPVTMMERWFDVVAMLLGGLIFGYIIGAIGNLVQQTSAKENEYHMAMNELDFFMNEMKLPLVMRTEISNYFQRLPGDFACFSRSTSACSERQRLPRIRR
jgi:hypothetical protein